MSDDEIREAVRAAEDFGLTSPRARRLRDAAEKVVARYGANQFHDGQWFALIPRDDVLALRDALKESA